MGRHKFSSSCLLLLTLLGTANAASRFKRNRQKNLQQQEKISQKKISIKKKDIWRTNKNYPFPKWSSTGKQAGDPDLGYSGVCVLGLIPDVKLKQSEGPTSMGKWLGKMLMGSRGVECELDEQCTTVDEQTCNSIQSGASEWAGMKTQPVCYRDKGQNACICGVVRLSAYLVASVCPLIDIL